MPSISSFWHYARERLRIARPLNELARSRHDRIPVVVSLTSYPARIGRVHLTIRSIAHQSSPPAQIVLVLARSEFSGAVDSLPSPLQRLLQELDGVLSILWVEENTRSYKKLIPARGEFPGRDIVTADDDVLYPFDWLSRLHSAHLSAPTAIIGSRGSRITTVSDGTKLAPYANWPRAADKETSLRVFLTGRGGIYYPVGSLNARVDDVPSATRLAPTADDVWFKACGILNGSPSSIVDFGEEFPPNGADQRGALYRENVTDLNDKALRAVFSELGIAAADFS